MIVTCRRGTDRAGRRTPRPYNAPIRSKSLYPDPRYSALATRKPNERQPSVIFALIYTRDPRRPHAMRPRQNVSERSINWYFTSMLEKISEHLSDRWLFHFCFFKRKYWQWKLVRCHRCHWTSRWYGMTVHRGEVWGKNHQGRCQIALSELLRRKVSWLSFYSLKLKTCL